MDCSKVYFAQAGDMVKVGCSQDPKSRLIAIAEWSPFKIKLVATIEAGFDFEAKLHRYFQESWSHGEWFHITPKIERVISAINNGDALLIPECPEIKDKQLVSRLKSKATRRVTVAEDAIYGWQTSPERALVRPEYVKDALASYKGAEAPPPSDEALEVISRYEAELASKRPLTVARLMDAIEGKE